MSKRVCDIHKKHCGGGCEGTTLLEVLASLVIVVLIMQLSYIILFSTSQTMQSGKITSASYYAVALIESIKVEGNDCGSYHITEGVVFNGLDAPAEMEAQVFISPVKDSPFLFLVEITVSWVSEGQPQELEMASIYRRD